MKRLLIAACVLLVLVAVAAAQDDAKLLGASELKFAPFPNVPTCIKGTVLHGDPNSEQGSTLEAKGTAGCKIPWHWHSGDEQVGVVSGSAKLEMKDAGAKSLTAGGYAFLPAKHPHQFTCVTACTIFVGVSGKFDIHYVDASGAEVPLEQAQKSGGKAAGAKAKAAAPKK